MLSYFLDTAFHRSVMIRFSFRHLEAILMSRGSAHFRRPTQGFSSSLWKSPVSSRSSSTSSMPSSHPRHQILVIGAGRMGTIRAAAFYGSRTSTLAGIVDADEAKAAELGRQYHAPAFSNLSTALRALPDV